ncbi:glycosyltransferase family 4 protein, partial [archaeon]|nr:glycosyltransferase family 4 protein [archaeon]
KKKLIKIVQGFSGNSETIKYKINQTNQILFMGRASKIRGIEFLLKSYAQLSKDIPSNLVILARSATDKQVSHLLELAYQYGLKNNVIKILGGWLSRDDLELHISQSSFLVQPFLLIPSETPISILESMSYGKPVIAPNLGGIPELLRHTGLVYKHNDPNDLVRVMREIILNKNLYFRLSENCKQYIEHYPSWGKLTVEIQKSFN